MTAGWMDQLPAGDRARFDPSIKTAAELAAAAAGSGTADRAGGAGRAEAGGRAGRASEQPEVADLRASAA